MCSGQPFPAPFVACFFPSRQQLHGCCCCCCHPLPPAPGPSSNCTNPGPRLCAPPAPAPCSWGPLMASFSTPMASIMKTCTTSTHSCPGGCRNVWGSDMCRCHGASACQAQGCRCRGAAGARYCSIWQYGNPAPTRSQRCMPAVLSMRPQAAAPRRRLQLFQRPCSGQHVFPSGIWRDSTPGAGQVRCGSSTASDAGNCVYLSCCSCLALLPSVSGC